MVETPFRITPSLGPAITRPEVQYYWDTISTPAVPSYPLGSAVTGSDGHKYVHAKTASVALAQGARITINETTWVATADAAGAFTAPLAIPANTNFHARAFTL